VTGVLLRACHPLPATAVTLLSGALAYALGQPLSTSALAAATVGASQLSIGWANDAIDAPRDQAARRVDKPLVARPGLRRTVWIAAWIAAACTGLAAIGWGWPRGFLIFAALILAQLYNWPLKGTAFSVVPYVLCFGLLPAFLAPGVPIWVLVAAGLLGGAAHFVNVIPDLADDAATGVRGLPHRLGARPSLYLASFLLLATTVVLVAGATPPLWAAVVATVGAGALPLLSHFAGPRTAFRGVIAIAALDVLLLVTSGVH
jgi:4-hydroxybenzoate polyprenyltransferase